MRIVLLCATNRGLIFLRRLANLLKIDESEKLPKSCYPTFDSKPELIVFSFRENEHEPPFFDNISDYCKSVGITLHEGKLLGSTTWAPFWEGTDFDLMFCVSWRFMLPPAVYNKAKKGAYIFHDSLLPSYRGFAPSVWAIINGEKQSGVSLFRCAEDMDSGDIVAQQVIPIRFEDTIADLMQAVNNAYVDLLSIYLPQLVEGMCRSSPQDHSAATFTCKRLPEDGLIDWNWPAKRVYNLIRALTHPYTGAFSFLDGRKLYLWKAKYIPDKYHVGAVPGRVVAITSEGAQIVAGDGNVVMVQTVSYEFDPKSPTKYDIPAREVLNNLSCTLRGNPFYYDGHSNMRLPALHAAESTESHD